MLQLSDSLRVSQQSKCKQKPHLTAQISFKASVSLVGLWQVQATLRADVSSFLEDILGIDQMTTTNIYQYNCILKILAKLFKLI